MGKLDSAFSWLKYNLIKVILIILYVLIIYIWFSYVAFKTDYNSIQLILTSIIQLLTTLIGIILAIIIFISPQIAEAKSKLKYSKPQISNYLVYGKEVPDNPNGEGCLIENVRLQLLDWINKSIDKDIKQDLIKLLEETSLLCIHLTNDLEYHKKVHTEILGNRNKKINVNNFISEIDFFNLIEKLHVAYWFRHRDIPNIPLYQNLFRDYISTDFFHNNLMTTFGSYMTGKIFNLILLLSSFLVITSLLTLSFITQDNFINGLHTLNLSCGVLLLLTILDIGIIANYIYKINQFMRNV